MLIEKMNAEAKDTRDRCANCCAVFGGTSAGTGSYGEDSQNCNLIPNPTRIMTLPIKLNGKEDTVQVTDALTEVYRLDWFLKIEGSLEDTWRRELNLCLDCFIVFSQLYKLFSEFQQLRKAESIVSKRLEVINTVVEVLLANSSSKDLGRSNNVHCTSLTDGHVNANAKEEQVSESDPSTPVINSITSLVDYGSSTEGNNIKYSVPHSDHLSTDGLENVFQNFELNEEPGYGSELDEICGPVDAGNCGSEEILGLDCGQGTEEEHRLQKESQGGDPNVQIFGCADCDMTFKYPMQLGRHRIRVHKTKEVYKCHVCMLVVRKNYNLSNHMRVHSSARPYKCKICPKAFKDNATVKKHVLGVHKTVPRPRLNWEKVKLSSGTSSSLRASVQPSSPAPASNNGNLTYKCLDCSEAFVAPEALGVHRLTVHSSKESLSSHMRCHFRKRHPPHRKCYRGARNLRSKYEKAYPCRFCTQNFSSDVNLAHHLTSAHVVDFSFQCTVCSSLVDTLEEWAGHAATHSRSSSRHECLLCGKIFNGVNLLLQHRRRHTRQKNFSCGICQCDFKARYDMKRHVDRHLDSKKSCGDLGEMPDEPGYRNPFVCKICNIGFPSYGDLCRHSHNDSQRIRENVDSNESHQFGCKFCKKVFVSMRILKLHSRVHSQSNSLPFYCQHCGDNYRTIRSLKMHHKLVHAKDGLNLDLPDGDGEEAAGTYSDPEEPSLQQSFALNIPRVNQGSHERSVPVSPPPPEITALVFKCTDCEGDFHSAETLGAHRSRVHQTVDLYKCHLCWQSFPDSSELRIHMAEHVTVGVPDDLSTVGRGSVVKVLLSEEVETKEEFVEPDIILLD